MRKNDKGVEDSWKEIKKVGMQNTQNTQQQACKNLESTDYDLKKITR